VALPLCSTVVVQKARIVSRPPVAVDVIVLAVMARGATAIVAVAVAVVDVDVPGVVDSAVAIGQDVISMLFELQLNVQEVFPFRLHQQCFE